MITDLDHKTREFEGGFIGRVELMLQENREIKARNAELLERIRRQRQMQPLHIGRK